MLTTARVFLALVATLYVALGVWCTVDPATTSQKVGLKRVGEGGKSEFVTVYGGLEVGLGLLLAILAWKPETAGQGVLACLVVHGSLVAFRTLSFAWYSATSGMTGRLAIGEWVIFLLSAGLYLGIRKG